MQRWVLFHIKSAERIAQYTSLAGARRGMRASNRNAGWARGTRKVTDMIEAEWCHVVDNTDQWAYGPYAIISEQHWQETGSYSNRKLLILNNLEMQKFG